MPNVNIITLLVPHLGNLKLKENNHGFRRATDVFGPFPLKSPGLEATHQGGREQLIRKPSGVLPMRREHGGQD